MNHQFDIDIAQKYSVNLAIFLNHIAFWTQKNIANKKHFYDGHFWTYSSYPAFQIIFPYWSCQEIRTIINKCTSHKLLHKGSFNYKRFDNTNWYALSDLGLSLFPAILEQFNTALLELTGVYNLPTPLLESTDDLLESTDLYHIQHTDISDEREKTKYTCAREGKHFQPLPRNQEKDLLCEKEKKHVAVPRESLLNVDTNVVPSLPVQNKTSEQEMIDPDFGHKETYYPAPIVTAPSNLTEADNAAFEEFWKLYPVKKNKNRAEAVWQAQGCTQMVGVILGQLKKQIASDKQFLEGFVPNPENYLKQEKWKDEIQPIPKKKGHFNYDDTSWADRRDMFDDIE